MSEDPHRTSPPPAETSLPAESEVTAEPSPAAGTPTVSGSPTAPGSGEAPRAGEAPGPPSASGSLEPYGAMVRLRPTSEGLDPLNLLPPLLEGIASGCVDQGASVIGHLKCLLRTGDGHVSCNLTSVRSGATCREGGVATVPAESEAELDLVVLVYDMPAAAVDELVDETLDRLLVPMGVVWAKGASFHA